MLSRIPPICRVRPMLLLVALALAALALLPRAALAAPDAPGQLYLPVLFQSGVASSPSSFNLIDEAVAKGEIDAETGLVYGMYAIFQDPRLPAQYRGDNSRVLEAEVQTRAPRQWNTLKPETRDLLLPFMIPPNYAGSWFDQRYGGGAVAGIDDAVICDHLTGGWNSVKTSNGKVRVWWNSRWPEDKAKAENYAISIDARIWAGLLEIHGAAHQPLSDQGAKCGGPDGLLDMFVTPISNSGYFMPLPEYFGPTVGCPAKIGQNQISRDDAGDDALATVIHELNHAFNASYSLGYPCSEFDWLDEASSEWAVDHVDPKNNEEHYWMRYFLETPFDPLETDTMVKLDGETEGTRRVYGASVFPFFLSRYRGGPRQIGDIFVAGATKSSLEAINTVVSGKLEKAWPDFALKAWNTPPVDNFRVDDSLRDRAKPFYTPEQSRIRMDGKEQWVKAVPSSEIQHLASRYYHFTFNDPNVRSVGWYNGITANLSEQAYIPGPGLPYHGQTYLASPATDAQRRGAHVWAIYKIAGRSDWEQPEDWTERGFHGFCRDVAAERITDLVLIYSNSQWEDRNYKLDAPGEEPQLFMSNIGCWRWEGKSTYSKIDPAGVRIDVEVDMVWERHSFGPWNPLPTLFKVVSATGTWRASGGAPCVASGSGPFTVDLNDEPQMTIYDRMLSGPAYRAYSGRGQTNQTITYTLTCPGGTQSVTEGIGVWWEPPTGQQPETTFTAVKADGITIEDTETRQEGGGVWTIIETRSLKAKSQP